MIIKALVIVVLLTAVSYILLKGVEKILIMRRDFSKHNSKK